MAKVLVIDRERNIRRALKDILKKNGYEVVEAVNGPEGIEAAGAEAIDLILLDVNLSKPDGWEVLTDLKIDRYTRKIPVIMLARFPSNETEETAMRLGAAHVLTKPWNPESLKLTIRVVLRAAQRATEDEPRAPRASQDRPPSRRATEEEPRARQDSQDPPPSRNRPSEPRKIIDTGGILTPLERVLGGGIRQESLTLVEGAAASGKSVICYYLAHGALLDSRSVAYFSSKYAGDGLVEQMGSLGLGTTDDFQEDRFRVYPLGNPGAHDDPAALLAALVSNIEHVPPNYGLVVVDNISKLAVISEDRAIMSLFSSCQRMCSEGKTILVVAQSSAFDQNLSRRLHGMCNTHMSISAEMIRDKFVKTLEVRKSGNVDLRVENEFSFEVEPESGIRIIPVPRVSF